MRFPPVSNEGGRSRARAQIRRVALGNARIRSASRVDPPRRRRRPSERLRVFYEKHDGCRDGVALRRVPQRPAKRRSGAEMRTHAHLRPRRGGRATSDRLRRCHRARGRRPERQHERHPCVPTPHAIPPSSPPLFGSRPVSVSHLTLPTPSRRPSSQVSPAPPPTCIASTSEAAFGAKSTRRARVRAPARRTPPPPWATWSWSRAASVPPASPPRTSTCSTSRARRDGTASSSAVPGPDSATLTSSPSSRSVSWSSTAETTVTDPRRQLVSRHHQQAPTSGSR